MINYTGSYSNLVIDFLPGEEKEKSLSPTKIKNETDNLDIIKIILIVDQTKLV